MNFQQILFKLIGCLRAYQLIAHNFHHTCGRMPFFQDHEFFGEIYHEMDDDYDGVAERFVGLYGSDGFNLQSIMPHVLEKLKSVPPSFKENYEMFGICLAQENEINGYIKALCSSPECSEGTKQLLGNISDKSETRIYKLKRRLMK